MNKYYLIIKKFKAYVSGYIKFTNNKGNVFDSKKYKFNALKYFHNELNFR